MAVPAAMVISIPVVIMVLVGVPVTTIVLRIPMGMVAVIVVPVIRTPRIPPVGIISPVPGRAPYNITRPKNEPDQWPGSHLIGCHVIYHHGPSIHINGIPGIARIGCFTVIMAISVIVGLNDIVFTIQGLIPDKLDPYLVMSLALNNEYGDILVFPGIDGHLQYNHVNIPVWVINYPYVIDTVIPVQVKVIDPGVLIIQVTFKTLKGLRFLK
jgi:hypothetical protein